MTGKPLAKGESVRKSLGYFGVLAAGVLITVLPQASRVLAQGQGQGASNHAEFVEGRILAKFRSSGRASEVAGQFGAAVEKELGPTGVLVLQLPNAASAEAVALAMSHHPDVEFAEVDSFVPPTLIPNDPLFPSQWHLSKISSPAAWDQSTGYSGLIVAVLDTGVDGTHPDLVSEMVAGWNMYDNNSNTADVYGHGTNVAGTIAAAADNANGVAGVIWNARIMPIRISDLTGYALYSTAAQGLTWAADHGARIANISFEMSTSSAVMSAAQYFQNHGGVVTIAAGNAGTLLSSADSPYVLTVSASDSQDLLASWSNRGSIIDVAAPGVGIYTTMRGGGYGSVSGTSFAAPVTAGVAALVLSANPNLTGAQALNIVKASADDLGAAGWDALYGTGRVNAASAVALALNSSVVDTVVPNVSFTSPQNGGSAAGTITVQVAATDNTSVASVNLKVDGVSVGTDATAPYTFSLNTLSLPNGSHALTATAVDTAGNVASAGIGIVVNNVTDTTKPVSFFTSPQNGATVIGNATLTASATDNISVVKTEIYIDGVLKASSGGSSASARWNTKPVSAGAHVLTAKSYDAAANAGTSSITVFVK
jgi:subtilisin family serine protease